jgi:hypothetical protein
VIPFLLAIVVIVVVGASYLAYRNRPESSIESGIHSFRREMRALAPPTEQGRRADPPGRPVEPERHPDRREPPTAGGD